jgi:hypothetical protein
VEQLPYHSRKREAEVEAGVLRQHANRRPGPVAVAALLPAVLARLDIKATEQKQTRDRSRTRVRIHTAYRPHGTSLPFQVPGALSDHHRRIRQFGADPLMYYLYGET